ncbi:MAG: hypothetical protein V1897_18360 [Pseudomonadota bacterium]
MRDNNRLDAISEMLALSSLAAKKNIIFSGLELKGPMNVQAMIEGVRRAAKRFPNFQSTLEEIKIKGRFHLISKFNPGMKLPSGFHELKIADESATLLNNVLYTLSHRLDRDWDLSKESPLESYLIRVSDEHHVLATFNHHWAGDVGSLMEYGQALMAKYHELVKGEKPHWENQPLAISSSKKRQVENRRAKKQAWLENARETLSGFLKSPSIPKGSGEPNDDRQFHVKRVLSPSDSRNLTHRTGLTRALLPDRLTAATHFAVDQWNWQRGISPGKLTSSMTVNMRGRYKALNNPNNSALIFLNSTPSERTDSNKFCRSLARQRMKCFRAQTDFSYYQKLERFNNTVRMLPFHLRRRVVSFIMDKHEVSVAITLLGVLWPLMENGRASGETFLEKTGDLVMTEVHGLGYKLASSTRLLLVAYIFRGQFNMILTSSATLFTRQESELFIDLIIKNLLI